MCPVSPNKVGVASVSSVSHIEGGVGSVFVSISLVEGDVASVFVLFFLVKEAWPLCLLCQPQ